MIPTDDESSTIYLTKQKEDKTNAHHSDSHSTWTHNRVACAEDNCYQLNSSQKMSHSFTDKPRLAHQVYLRWLALSSLNGDDVTCNLSQRLSLKGNDLLIAAYTGSSLMYRK